MDEDSDSSSGSNKVAINNFAFLYGFEDLYSPDNNYQSLNNNRPVFRRPAAQKHNHELNVADIDYSPDGDDDYTIINPEFKDKLASHRAKKQKSTQTKEPIQEPEPQNSTSIPVNSESEEEDVELSKKDKKFMESLEKSVSTFQHMF